MPPMRGEDPYREYVPQNHIHDHTYGEGDERPGAGTSQLAESGRQSDTEETEDKRPGAKVLDRRHQRRSDLLVVVREAVVAGDPGHQQRSQQEPDNKFRKSPPDLHSI